MDAKKSSLGLWEGCTSPKGSKWLADNLEAVDENVKLMLKLIEEDGDSFAKKAEMYYQKRPQLISCVDELHGQYCLLAERYYHLFKELHKNGAPLQAQSMSNEVDPVSQFYTPVAKLGATQLGHHGSNSDMNVTSPESNSDHSLKTGSLSASLSDTDSDLFNSINDISLSSGLMQNCVEMGSEYVSMKEQRKLGEVQPLPCGVLNGDDEENHDGMLGRIKEYEEELCLLKLKLKLSEEELGKCNSAAHDKEVLIMDLQSRLQEAHMDIEEHESKLAVAEDKVVDLQHKLSSYKTDVSRYEGTIGDLKAALCHVQEHLFVSVAQLESDIGNLLEQKNQLEAELTKTKLQNTSTDIELQEWKDQIMNKEQELKRLRAENLASEELVTKLNGSAAELKRTLQTLSAELNSQNSKVRELEVLVEKSALEKDAIAAKLTNLKTEVSFQTEETNQLINDLRSEVILKEEELETLRSQIKEGAENKREAIRQLCFSLDHYRSGYKELCQAFIITNQRSVSAS